MSAVERTLILKAAPSVPAGATNLAWSDDNQLVAVTADALAILTPAPTFRATGPGAATAELALAQTHAAHTAHPLTPVDLTAIPAPTDTAPPLPTQPDAPAAAASRIGRIDAGALLRGTYRGACWSPRQSTPWGGCALLAWTHDYRVTVHAPAAHPATSAWPVVLDLTPHIHQGLVTARGGSPLDAQIVSAAWSPGPPPPPEPVASPTGTPLLPPVARSVIALGSKAGHLSLWAYAAIPNDPTLHVALEAIVHLPTTAARAPPSPAARLVPRADDEPESPWVTSLAWSPASHWLAYALSTGAVGLVHVSLSPDSQQLSTHLVALVADADPRLVSTLTWVAPTVVAAAKGNAVFLWDVAAHTLRTVSVGPHGVIAALVPTADGTAVRVFTVAGNMYVVTLDGDVDHAEARATQRVFLARHGIYVPKGRQAAAQAAAATAKAPRTSPASNGTPINGQGDEDDEEEEEEDDEDDEGVSVPSLTKKQARFYGACRSPNGIFTVVLYSIFPLNELYYRTDKSNTSFIDILPTTPVGDTDVEDAIFARLLHALQRGAGVPPTDAAAVPLGPGPWTLFWDLLAHVRHERRGRVPDMSSLARRLARVLDHWAIESAHAVQATHGVVPLFGRLRDFYTPMRWQAIVHRVLPVPTVLDLVQPTSEPPLPPPLAVHAAYLAEIVRDLAPAALSVLATVDDWLAMGAIVGAVALVGAGRAAFKGTLAALVAVLRRWQAQSATATAPPGFGGHDIDAWVAAATMAELATDPNAVLAAWTPAMGGGIAVPPGADAPTREPCPACGAAVAVVVHPGDARIMARCVHGHLWPRCALTLTLLATPAVRGCLACPGVKAVAPPPRNAPDSLVALLARQAQCPHCGDRFAWRGRAPPACWNEPGPAPAAPAEAVPPAAVAADGEGAAEGGAAEPNADADAAPAVAGRELGRGRGRGRGRGARGTRARGGARGGRGRGRGAAAAAAAAATEDEA